MFNLESFDDDMLFAGKDSYASVENRNPIYTLRSGVTTVWFATEPWGPEASSRTDWLNYRSMSTMDGLKGGIALPPYCYNVAVNDLLVVNGKRIVDRSRDYLVDLIAPSRKYPSMNTKDGSGAKASDRLAVNVIIQTPKWNKETRSPEVDPRTGLPVLDEPKHVVLTMSATAARDLKMYFNTCREANDAYSALSFPYRLEYIVSGSNTTLKVSALKEMPQMHVPEPYNVQTVLSAQRAEIDAFVEGILSGSEPSAVADAPAPVDGLAYSEDSGTEPEFFSGSTEVSFELMPVTRLRKMLVEAGVTLPPRATHAALIELAKARLS